VTLKVEGTVVALIDVKPSTNIIFRGMADQMSEAALDLFASYAPFHVSGTDSSLKENIAYKIDTIEDGKHYRLRVSNKVKRGNYNGFIKVMTDMAQKPEVVIRVSGYIEGEVSVKPQVILIGKLSANQPERTGRILVMSNRNKPFQITRIIYDPGLVSVEQQTLENQAGFSLEVTPKLSGLPAGARKQTTVSIETDASPGEKDDVQVHLFNSTDQPEATPK
jgi:hypothetical protein